MTYSESNLVRLLSPAQSIFKDILSWVTELTASTPEFEVIWPKQLK